MTTNANASGKISHLEKLCVVHTDFNIWSGQVRLTADDLKLGAGGEIPPEKIAQRGTKKICDPAKLNGFHRLKTDARRNLLRVGMPFMNGHAIPVARTDDVVKKLDEIHAEFEKLRHEFILGYHQAIDDWCKENPEYETAIRAGAKPRDFVQKRIGFEFQVFMIAPAEDEKLNERLGEKVKGLGDELIAELVEDAEKFYTDRLMGRDKAMVSTKATLRNMRDKLDGLAFLNSNIKPLVDLINDTLNGYATYAVGREVTGPFFHQLTATVLILSSKARIEQFIKGAINVKAEADALGAQAPQSTGGAPTSTSAQPQAEQAEDLFSQEASQTPATTSSSNPADALLADMDSFIAGLTKTDANEQSLIASNVVHAVVEVVDEAPAPAPVATAPAPQPERDVIDVQTTVVEQSAAMHDDPHAASFDDEEEEAFF